jgi:hypothetical protein
MATNTAVWLSATLLVISGCGQRWQSYSSTAGGFSVSMPGVPTYSKETLHPAGMTVDLHKFKLVFDGESLGYSVMYADFPAQIARAVGPEKLLDFAQSGATMDPGVRLIARRGISLGVNPGREISVETSNGLVCKDRFYVVNQRLYQVIAAVPKADKLSSDMTRFLDSFRLLKR